MGSRTTDTSSSTLGPNVECVVIFFTGLTISGVDKNRKRTFRAELHVFEIPHAYYIRAFLSMHITPVLLRIPAKLIPMSIA